MRRGGAPGGFARPLFEHGDRPPGAVGIRADAVAILDPHGSVVHVRDRAFRSPAEAAAFAAAEVRRWAGAAQLPHGGPGEAAIHANEDG